MRSHALAFAAIALAVIAVAPPGTIGAQRGAAQPLLRQSWTIDGVARDALVSPPTGNVPDRGGPLVFVFHGHGGTSMQAARTFRIHDAWPEAVVIYPQGLPTPGQITDPEGRRPGWQHLPDAQGGRDVKLFDAMLAWADDRFSIDARHVFAAGHSNGGSMVYVLWAARGDRFAALAPSSSVFRPDVIKAAKPKPAFIVAGRKDALVPFAAQQLSLNRMLGLNQAARTDQPWSGGARLHKSTAGADVVAYVHPGGHPMPADAGELMVKFFKERAPK